MKTFKFELDTPYRRFFSDEIEALTLTLPDGEITIYADHSYLTAPVAAGFARIKNKQGVWKNAFVAEGILEVKDGNTLLMANAAEWPEEINKERAEKSLASAKETINAGTFKFETNAAKASALRAEFRLKVKENG